MLKNKQETLIYSRHSELTFSKQNHKIKKLEEVQYSCFTQESELKHPCLAVTI